MTRRQLARGAAGAVAGAGVVAGLAACENTTTPIGAEAAGATGAAAELVVQKPTGPGGLPLPRTDNSVTWAITDENKPIKDGRQARARPAARSTTTPTTSTRRPSRSFQKQFSTQGRDRDLQLVRRGDREAVVRRGRLRPDHRA